VADLEGSIEFYSTLFGVQPTKRRPGYANFAITEPSLKLVLLEGQPEQATVMDHLGVEVDPSEQVAAATERLAGQGLATDVENDTTCCYARQDKVWCTAPETNPGRSTPSKPTPRPSANRPPTPPVAPAECLTIPRRWSKQDGTCNRSSAHVPKPQPSRRPGRPRWTDLLPALSAPASASDLSWTAGARAVSDTDDDEQHHDAEDDPWPLSA
jgi:catechol 2,3-dioxygenase-like lactoylglutathione lyase family enzyme